MHRYLYTFEELTPYPEYDILVGGCAEVNWEIFAAEPDVGIMRGGVSFDIENIYVYSNKKDRPVMPLKHGTELYTKIEKELLEAHDTQIENEILEMIED